MKWWFSQLLVFITNISKLLAFVTTLNLAICDKNYKFSALNLQRIRKFMEIDCEVFTDNVMISKITSLFKCVGHYRAPTKLRSYLIELEIKLWCHNFYFCLLISLVFNDWSKACRAWPGFLYCFTKKLCFRPQRWRCEQLFCNTTTKKVLLY